MGTFWQPGELASSAKDTGKKTKELLAKTPGPTNFNVSAPAVSGSAQAPPGKPNK